MNPNSEPHARPMPDIARLDEEMLTHFGPALGSTAARFDLTRPIASGVTPDIYMRDMLTPDNQRMLIVERQALDYETYGALARANIPQLQLAEATDSLQTVAIPTGAKLLVHEPIFNREASATYISDKEVYELAGKIYGAAWLVTRRMLISGSDDSPLNHLAMTNFPDDNGYYMYLCPPYADSIGVDDLTGARQIFEQSMLSTNDGNAQDATVMAAALRGFDLMTQPPTGSIQGVA